MDSNIIVAIVGAASALAGSLIGGILSHHGTSKQIRFETLSHLYDKKSEVYSYFLAEYHTYMALIRALHHDEERDLSSENTTIRKFSAAFSSAALLAPSPIADEMRILFDLATQYGEGRLSASIVGEKYLYVENLLRNDLQK